MTLFGLQLSSRSLTQFEQILMSVPFPKIPHMFWSISSDHTPASCLRCFCHTDPLAWSSFLEIPAVFLAGAIHTLWNRSSGNFLRRVVRRSCNKNMCHVLVLHPASLIINDLSQPNFGGYFFFLIAYVYKWECKIHVSQDVPIIYVPW